MDTTKCKGFGIGSPHSRPFFRHAPLHPLRVVRPVSTRHLKMITGRRPQTSAPPAHLNNEYDWKYTGLTILDTEKSKQICLVVARLNNGLDIRVCRNITPNICWSHVEIEEGRIEKGGRWFAGVNFTTKQWCLCWRMNETLIENMNQNKREGFLPRHHIILHFIPSRHTAPHHFSLANFKSNALLASWNRYGWAQSWPRYGYVFTVRWCGTWYGIVVHGTVRGTVVVRIYGTVVRYMVRYCGTWYGTWYGCGTYLRYGGAVHGAVLWYMVRYVVRITVRWCGTWYGIVVHGTVRGTVVVRIYGTVVRYMVRYCGTWFGTRYDCGAYFWSGGVAHGTVLWCVVRYVVRLW